ncbi:hypothetical protein [Desulfolutivibrio sulfoxidireducens]|uniref:hypothetical protein n=1 Tax=Desulfolutivibrio sulfoxidireducens TaxID=2773299 RepID=UPI00159D1F56|nr:hypothetical protein [Desulfolutivibrio sulfoxidireducens]QLA18951.1 hypothetical protein GD604_03975 [Desulfolutivibrio sulfoxidireducens]
MSESRERNYNRIFEKLAGEPDDLIGLLAYGIYKREKIEYIQDFCGKNGRGPTDEELSLFHDASLVRLEQYHKLAEVDLTAFLDSLAEEEVQAVSQEMDRRLKEELLKAKPSWKASIIQSFLGSVLFTFFVGMIVIIIIGWRYGVNTIIQEGTKMMTGQ